MNAVFADAIYKKPIYSLEVNIYGTGAEIRFNDIPVYYHDTKGQTSSQKPVPESIIDGENVLMVKSFPLEENGHKYEKGAHIEAIISVREKDAPLNKNKPILQLKLNPMNLEEKLLDGTLVETGGSFATLISHSDQETIAERRVNVESPFPRWAWQDGQIIEDTPENFKSLLNKYNEVWNALNNGDKNEVRKLYDFAAQEFSWAYNYKDKENGHSIMNTGGLMGDNDWKLGSIDKFLKKFSYRLDIFSNGKMARILDQKNRTPIVYLSRKAKIISIQKFSFYKSQQGEWIMIR